MVNNSEERTTVSYARYLLSVKLGRYLTDDEEADHIDADKTNDSLENLQVLSREEHIKKTISDRPICIAYTAICTFCTEEFKVPPWKFKTRKNFFCSRSCNAKFTRSLGKWAGIEKWSSSVLLQIKELYDRGNTGYKIAKILNLSSGGIYTHLKQFKKNSNTGENGL